MASSTTTPQILINESEINEMLRIINAGKNSEVKIVGKLFGEWNESSTQPVIQLITGPGQRAKISKKSFSPDGYYHIHLKKYLESEHGLSQIGLWCSGSANRYPTLNRNSGEYHNALMPQKGDKIVLMFVPCTQGKLEIQYRIIDRENPELSQVATLTSKDVLSGGSKFREMRPVFYRINDGAKYPSLTRDTKRLFFMNMLPENRHRPSELITTTRVAPDDTSVTPTRGEQTHEQLFDDDEFRSGNTSNGFKSPKVAVERFRRTSARSFDKTTLL